VKDATNTIDAVDGQLSEEQMLEAVNRAAEIPGMQQDIKDLQAVTTVANWDTFNPVALNIPIGGQRNVVGAGAPNEVGAPMNGNATAAAGTVVRTGANVYVVQTRRALATNNVQPVLFQRPYDANTETWADWVDFVDGRMLPREMTEAELQETINRIKGE